MKVSLLMRCLLTIFFLSLFISATSQQVYSQEDKNAAYNLVQNNLKDLGLSKSDVDNLYISDSYTDKLSGVLMVYLQQQYKTINIHNALYNIAFKNGKVVSSTNTFIKKLNVKANSEIPIITPTNAINTSASHLKISVSGPLSQLRVVEPGKNFEFSNSSISKNKIPVKLVWVSLGDSLVRLSWEVHIDPPGTNDMWNVRIDALKGNVLEKDNWTVNCTWDRPFPQLTTSARQNKRPALRNMDEVPGPASVFSNTSANAVPLTQNSGYMVIPFPFESPLYSGSQSLKTNPWLMAGADNAATSYGWHFDGTNDYSYTRGNNVFAQDDIDNNNTTPGTVASSTTSFPNLSFNYPLESSKQPNTTNNLPAAITNLFYWNNIIHDIAYQYGFDEAAGNFQKDNLGKGGIGNDYVLADAQDGSGLDNANFSTPPDGESGRMQMYVFSPIVQFLVNTPGTIAGNYGFIEIPARPFGFLRITGSKSSTVALYNDNELGSSNRACVPAFNAQALAGKIALIDRGGCTILTKVKNAQNAGAIAVIVIDTTTLVPVSSIGLDSSITIPSIMISQVDGIAIKNEVIKNVPVNVTIDVAPSLDGDLDNGVIIHEYAHGISTRLTGGPANSSCLDNWEQMGEGWSDYYALMLTTDWSNAQLTDGTKRRPVGNYVLGEPVTGAGIRTYPYSTDMSINPWTYSDVESTFGEEHLIGEIWCAVIWDMTWDLIKKDGVINADLYNANGSGGNSAALKLVNLGMKLQPCKPGFVDGRNAILKADSILYDGKYSCVIWKAFARRGLGINASQGISDDPTDQVEDFNIPAGAIIRKSVNKNAAGMGDILDYNFAVQCQCAALNGLVIKDTLPGNVIYQSGGSVDGNVVTFSPINLEEQSLTFYNVSVKVNDSYSAPVNHLTESVPTPTINAAWTRSILAGTSQWNTNTVVIRTPPYSFKAPDSAKLSDFTLATTNSYPLTRLSTLSFYHYYNTEFGYDGGVVELSTNNGATWIDAGPYMLENGYPSIISEYTNSSIAGRKAFNGYSGNAWLQTIIDLSSFAGKSMKFRFRFCSDQIVGGDGWYIDDILLRSEAGIYNAAYLFRDVNLLSRSSARTFLLNQAPLPITMAAFDVVKQKEEALISWQTLNETNAEKFEVEKSIDGINFQVIGTVQSSGWSSSAKNYQFTDVQPVKGKNYYRLKQTDVDGKFIYTAIKTIVFDDESFSISLKPNPSNGIFTVNLPPGRDIIQLNIFDSKGILVQKERLTGVSQPINLSTIPKGIYILNFQLKDKTVIKKIIIQ